MSIDSARGPSRVDPDGAPADGNDRRTVVALRGDLDHAKAFEVADALARAIAATAADLVVDLSDVTFLDAAAVGVLIRGRNFLQRQSRDLTLRSPSHPAWRVLDVCGLTSLLEPGSAGPSQ
jgi:anti-sigma B factor antagonist